MTPLELFFTGLNTVAICTASGIAWGISARITAIETKLEILMKKNNLV